MSGLPELIKDLLLPDAYPHKPRDIKLVQTHISYVFLVEDLVYKIKKPVDFGFLDFTSLEKRHYFCKREVELNRRLCGDVYVGVVPVVKEGKRYVFEGKGEPLEWAVKMRRLPEEGMMGRLIAEKRLTQKHIDLLVKKLVPFYKTAATGPEVNKYGSLDTVSFNVEENFSQTNDFVGKAISEYRYQHIVSWSRAFMQEKAPLFEERIKEGFIRDGHGDLYSANICFDERNDEVYVFDCIEFNDRFRCGDVAQDLAFLAMDLDFHGLQEFSSYFIDQYVAFSGDKKLYEILDFYKCYRAYVRGKIGCFTWTSQEVDPKVREESLNSAKRYFDLAFEYAKGKPFLIVIFGLSGTGKSFLARELSKRLLTSYYNSDTVRKTLQGIQPEEHHYEPFEQGIYRPEITERTYEALAEYAKNDLLNGKDVILDATYRSKKFRKMILEKTRDINAKILFVLCEAPEDVIKKRLEERAKKAFEPSDGRWEIYLKQKQIFEPPEDIPSQKLLILNTSQNIEDLTNAVISTLMAKA